MQYKRPITEQVLALRGKCKEYAGQTEQLLNLPENTPDHRRNCFSMIFNDVTLAVELLSYYYSRWSKPRNHSTSEERERARQENAERVIAALKYLFVFSLSAMEYNARKSIEAYPSNSTAHNLLATKPRYRNLASIMKKSWKQNLISEDTFEEWETIIYIRNKLVHNNGQADKTGSYTIDGLIIETVENEMMKGKLNFFSTLTDLAVDRYFNWMKELIAKYGG